MTKLNVTVTFHSIARCGHYRWGQPLPALGGVVTTLEDLKKWSTGKPISLTKLAGMEVHHHMPAYLFGIEEDDDGWIIATWNEVPAGEGGVASVAIASVVGQEPTVYANDVVADSIPGYATYFWVVPSKGVIASLRLEGAVTGNQALRSYVEAFLQTQSRYAVIGDEGEVVGYRDPADPDQPPMRLHGKFRTSAYVKAGPLAHIRANRDQIVKVVRTARLQVTNRLDQAAYQGVLRFLRGASPKRTFVTEKSLKVELEMTPSPTELDAMIDEELNARHVASWEDLGFVMKGQPSVIHWVSKSMARETFEMNLDISSAGVATLASFRREVKSRRHQLLAILD